MASKTPVWGIDVGQCSLKALKVQATGDQVEMLAFDLVEHETMLSQADADATTLISKAIQTFAQRNDLKGSRIAIAVPGQQTLTRFTKMPPVEAKKIPDMVQYEASQQIPFDMDEVVWDYQIFQEKDSPDVEVGIFAIRKELIRNYVAYFTDAGIEPALVQTGPMAAYNAAKYEGVQGEGQSVVLLDMGALATDLIIMEGSRIWARQIPIGGNRFTDALSAAFKIPFAKAEKLKRTAATSKYAKQIFAAMRPIFADLVSDIQRSIGFYTSTHREAHINKVVGMGNAFKLHGLQKFFEQNLQMEVVRLSSFKKLTTLVAENSTTFTENAATFGAAYGLALQGLDLGSVTSSLLPLEVRKALLWRKKRNWFGAAAACLAVGSSAIWIGNSTAKGQVESVLGGPDVPSPIAVKSPEDAERVLSNPTGDTVGKRAAAVIGAANRLRSALDEVDKGKKGDQALFTKMAKLTENNVFIPRIVDLIHRSLAEVQPAELKDILTSADYLQYVKSAPRTERGEVFIDKLDMVFDAKDPARLFKETSPDKGSAVSKPGWGVRVVGTSANPKLATWLEETLQPMLQRLGREPGRGIHVDQVAISKVDKKGV
ncbi:MAG: type IV pilus assembly protein PilM, partial [Planctomycetota bacterium]